MVDILLATYNGEKYLPELLDSVLNQGFRQFHLYIRDDGSTDGTNAILDDYAQRYVGNITVVRDEKRLGSAKDNFFCLMGQGTANYIMFADQDDVWNPDKVERTVQAMTRAETDYGSETPILVHTDLTVVDEALRPIEPSLMRMQKLNPSYRTPNRLLVQNNVTGCTVMVNRALLKRGICSDERIIMHDWWLALIAAEFGKIVFLEKPSILYRQHNENRVGAKDVKSADYFKTKVNNTDKIHQSIIDTYRQAQAFYDQFGDMIHEKRLYTDFIGLQNSSAAKRISVLWKHRLLKSGLYRKIGQIIYG